MKELSAPSAVDQGLSADRLASILACPACGTKLAPPPSDGLTCPGCGAKYGRRAHAWDMTPPRDRWTPGQWEAWRQLQRNGEVSYQFDPEHNLAFGERDDALAFARFCGFDGLVLDVGCGPQRWPSYFAEQSPRTRFVGIDPLVGDDPAPYTKVRGLAEHLPFADACFDHVVFATTLDHFVDPARALREARRVVMPGGEIDVWIGHKSHDAPPPEVTAEWYEGLATPEGADDVFHIKRLDPAEMEALFDQAGLERRGAEDHRIDEWRSNHFRRFGPGR